MKNYDLTIIGSGPGGYVAALYASRHNLRICVVEKGPIGGTCLNRGCIPTKVMLNTAAILKTIKESQAHGIRVSSVEFDFAASQARKDQVVSRLGSGIESLFRSRGVDVVKGAAKLVGVGTVSVNGESLIHSKSIILATGSRPAEMPGAATDETGIFSSDGIVDIRHLPGSLLIIGGGVIGVEFATAFSAFGVKVALVEIMDRLVPSQSREASKKLETILKKNGVDILTSQKVESIVKKDSFKVKTSSGMELEADKILVAIGRRSNVEEVGCDELGIDIENGRIRVDTHLRTSVNSIYAIGDCVKGPLLAHKASYDGILAVDNILGDPREVDYSNIPGCVYTDPEIASVGPSEEEAIRSYPGAKITKFPYLASGKAYLMARAEGFIKIIGDAEGKLLGMEIFGEGACDLIGEGVMAKMCGMSIEDMSRVVHGHPTISEIIQEAAHIYVGTGIHSV